MNASVGRSAIRPARRDAPVMMPLHRGCLLVVATATVAAPAVHAQAARESGVIARVDSSYSSPSLRALIERVSFANATVPAGLAAYRVGVESEIGIVLRTAVPSQGLGAGARDVGRERVLQVEQIASDLSWARSGEMVQHVIGYRSRSITTAISALSVMRHPWVIPTLYGNRLQLMLGRDADADSATRSPDGPTASRAAATMTAVHPFAEDRDATYLFSGGDTIAVLRIRSRNVTLVRITVEPRPAVTQRGLLRFRGTIDVDAERAQIVRMHGQFVVTGARRSLLRRVLAPAWRTMMFADLQNGEYDGRYWLPTTQRIEAQTRSALAADFRPIVRVVSRFGDYRIDATLASNIGVPDTATASGGRARLTFAPRDTLDRYADWRGTLGGATSSGVRGTDFDDVAPERLQSTGAPLLEWRAERVNDVFRFNRVEGVFTGAAAAVRFRDAVPGLSAGAHAGWAWKNETARGALWSRFDRAGWTLTGRVERALANTNDFRPPLDYEQTLMAMLVTSDDYDYLDRTALTVGATRTLRVRGAPSVHIEFGPARDAAVAADVRYGLIHLDSAFRANRAIAAGRYFRSAVGIDVHPEVTGDFLGPGVGASLWFERGDGSLRWQRLEGRITARQIRGPVTIAGRLDGIVLDSRDIVPQQLIEFGESEGLPGYAYKEFGGDRATLLRGAIEYQLPWLRAPIHVGSFRRSRVMLPGISPALAVGVNAGWADARQQSTRAALALFGQRTDTLTGGRVLATRPTDGIRSTVSVSLRLFGGSFGIGIAKPFDARGSGRSWSFVIGAGQPF
jgi:hypothetical protein